MWQPAQGGLVILAAAYGRPAAVEALLSAICRGEEPPHVGGAGVPGEASTSEAAGPAVVATAADRTEEADASAADDRCFLVQRLAADQV